MIDKGECNDGFIENPRYVDVNLIIALIYKCQNMIALKCDKLYVKWKCYDNLFNGWIDKKDGLKMSQNFLKPYKHYCRNVKAELDLSNYLIKPDSKGAAGVNTFNLAGNPDLASLKVDVDEIDIKPDSKGAAGVNTSNLAGNPDLASLKVEVDEIDINKKLFLLI